VFLFQQEEYVEKEKVEKKEKKYIFLETPKGEKGASSNSRTLCAACNEGEKEVGK